VGVTASKDLIIAADFGTSSVKVGLVSEDMRVMASATARYGTAYPRSGWAEQEPQDWWRALGSALATLGEDVPDLRARAAGLVFCAQMCGLVCASADAKPLRPCLIWQDKRSSALTRRYVGGFPSVLGYNSFKGLRWLLTGNGVPSMSGGDAPGKILWLQQNEPKVWSRTAFVLDVRDWLVLRASGRAVTTPDCATMMWLGDMRPNRCQWSPSLMRSLGVTREQLPDVLDGSDMAGQLTAAAAADLHLDEGIPVFAGCGDVCASAIGSGATASGALHIYAGTSSWIGGFFDSRRLNPFQRYGTITSAAAKRPLLIATQESTGSCFEWIADIVDQEGARDEAAFEQLMERALAPSSTLPAVFLPWLAGERSPVDDNRLRGALVGLSLDHDRSSILRAVLEGIVLSTRWSFRSVERQPGVVRGGPVRLVGRLAANRPFCQLLADCLGREVKVDATPHLAGVRGVATIAAVGLGWRQSLWSATVRDGDDGCRIFTPDPLKAAYFDDRMREFRYAYRRLLPWFRQSSRTAHLDGALPAAPERHADGNGAHD
jgi:xylulokinase